MKCQLPLATKPDFMTNSSSLPPFRLRLRYRWTAASLLEPHCCDEGAQFVSVGFGGGRCGGCRTAVVSGQWSVVSGGRRLVRRWRDGWLVVSGQWSVVSGGGTGSGQWSVVSGRRLVRRWRDGLWRGRCGGCRTAQGRAEGPTAQKRLWRIEKLLRPAHAGK